MGVGLQLAAQKSFNKKGASVTYCNTAPFKVSFKERFPSILTRSELLLSIALT
jgi:hypothetical protein